MHSPIAARVGPTTLRKSDHGIQGKRLRCHGASHPVEGRDRTAQIELEDFDRFPIPVANDIQRSLNCLDTGPGQAP